MKLDTGPTTGEPIALIDATRRGFPQAFATP
jgi:hypothetical protein